MPARPDYYERREAKRRYVGATDAPADRDDPETCPLIDAIYAELEDLRVASGFSYLDLALEADMSPDAFRRAIKGYRRRRTEFGMHLRTLERVLAAMNLSFIELAHRVTERMADGKGNASNA